MIKLVDSRFLRRGSSPLQEGEDRAAMSSAAMTRYLMAMLGQRGGLDPLGLFALGMGDHAAGNGRLGDYVLNQEGKIMRTVILCRFLHI